MNNQIKKHSRNIGFVILILLFVGAAFWLGNTSEELEQVPLSQVVQQANQGKLEKITVEGNTLTITPKGAEEPQLESRKEPDTSLADAGIDYGEVNIEVKEESNTSSILFNVALTVGPFLLLIAFFAYMMKQAQGQGSQALNFGKSKARIFGNEKEKIDFDDVAGVEEAKEELQEVVEFLKYPKKFENIGAKIPKGVLMFGPPGTGKTLLARAVAGEAEVPFFSISGSEFVEMFVGVGASRVRDLFNKAKKNAPCIVFIDEIDAVGRRRGSGLGGGHDEREQTLNQILVEMDGFEQGTNVIVMAATNRPDVLDPALLRPGRFDRRVTLDLPDRKDREAILRVHLEEKPTNDGEIEEYLDSLAGKTAGMSGADLANVVNESAIIAARRNKKKVGKEDLDDAFEKVALGRERKSKVMSEEEKELTAYHEAGHTIVGHVLPKSDPVHKVTIVSRGKAGGVTWFIPEDDKRFHSIVEFKDVLARGLGGRIAEKVIYGDDNVTTGAGNDLKQAAGLARRMVKELGMGQKLRNLVFNTDDNEGMLFDRMVHDRRYSEKTARDIDEEVANLIQEAAERAELVIRNNIDSLKKLASILLEKETLEEGEIKEILTDAKMPKAAATH